MNMNINDFKTSLITKIDQLNELQNKKRNFDLEMDRCNESSVEIGSSLQTDIRAFLTLSQAAPPHIDPEQQRRHLENLAKLRDIESELGRNQQQIVEQSKAFMKTMERVTVIQTMLARTIQSVKNISHD